MMQESHAICIGTTMCLYYFFANTEGFSSAQSMFSSFACWCISLCCCLLFRDTLCHTVPGTHITSDEAAEKML